MEPKKPISHTVAGLLIAGILIVFSITMSFISGAASKPGSGWISYLVIIAGLCLFIYLYGRSMNNTVSFGDLFAYGFKSTAIIVVVFVIFLIIVSFAFPEFKQKAIQAARDEMENQGKMNDSDIEKGIELVSKYFWVFAIGGTVLGFVIIGAIGSLLGAAITPKKPNSPFEQLNS